MYTSGEGFDGSLSRVWERAGPSAERWEGEGAGTISVRHGNSIWQFATLVG